MAEIRSTLDIIMEKAKELTVTDQDKRDFAEKEVQGRVKGFFQKTLDGILKTRQLKTEMASFDEEQRPVAEKELLAACLAAMRVEGDNQPIFEMLDQVLGCRIEPVLDLMGKFQEQQNEARAKRTSARIQALKGQGVSGSAVRPNLAADSTWLAYLSDMEDRFRNRLKTSDLTQ